MRNHAPHVLAADFFTVVTAKFDILRVLVVMETGSRRILHFNVTEHPTTRWTLQQSREALPWENNYRYLIQDRDSIFAASFDEGPERIWPPDPEDNTSVTASQCAL